MQNVNLIARIQILIVSSLVPFLDRYPQLKTFLNSIKSDNPTEEWDFFMITAISGILLNSDDMPIAKKQSLLEKT